VIDGLVSVDQRTGILARYAVDRSVAERRGRVVLTALAVLASAIAVLLVIGYNWDAIVRPAKVAIIFGAVAAVFGASAAFYARGPTTGGELFAFAGTLLYGNAIWLLAQVFHIGAHYPDGALWWATGALATGALVRSRLVAIEAAVLVLLWLVMETSWFAQPNYLFVAIGGVTIALAYHVRSAWTLAIAAVATVIWIVTATGVALDAGRVSVGLGVLAGCTFHAASRLHDRGSTFARVWHSVGLTALAAFLIPFMATELHEPLRSWPAGAGWPILAIAAGLVGVLAILSTRRPFETEDLVVRLIGVFAAIWMVWVAMAAGDGVASGVRWSLALLASGLTLSMGIVLIRTGAREDRGWLFAAGVFYVLLFILVRWIDLVGNMLWSALLLLASAGALFWMARLWSTRRKEAS
jgi:uncharacterized membrane protein